MAGSLALALIQVSQQWESFRCLKLAALGFWITGVPSVICLVLIDVKKKLLETFENQDI